MLIAYSINTGLLTRYVFDVEERGYDGDSGSPIERSQPVRDWCLGLGTCTVGLCFASVQRVHLLFAHAGWMPTLS